MNPVCNKYPVEMAAVLNMTVQQMENMSLEFYSILNEKNLRYVMYVMAKFEEVSQNYKKRALQVIRKYVQVHILERVRDEWVKDLDLPDLAQGTSLEQIVKAKFLRSCLNNEMRLWRVYAKSVPSHVFGLTMRFGSHNLTKLPVYFSPFGHREGELPYKTARLCQRFVRYTMMIMVLNFKYHRFLRLRRYTIKNQYYLHNIVLWSEYFGYLTVIEDAIAKLLTAPISYCPLCAFGHKADDRFKDIVDRQVNYLKVLYQSVHHL